MKRISREKVKVDRVAYPWLIWKFIDPQAEFIIYDALCAGCQRRVSAEPK